MFISTVRRFIIQFDQNEWNQRAQKWQSSKNQIHLSPINFQNEVIRFIQANGNSIPECLPKFLFIIFAIKSSICLNASPNFVCACHFPNRKSELKHKQ